MLDREKNDEELDPMPSIHTAQSSLLFLWPQQARRTSDPQTGPVTAITWQWKTKKILICR